MSDKNLRILLIEDDQGDAQLIREMLDNIQASRPADFSYELVHVGRLADALDKIRERKFDLILLDLSLPDSNGLQSLLKIRIHGAGIPVIILAGLDDELVAIQAIRGGAQDYLVKGHMNSRLLGRYLRFAVERQQLLCKLDGSESRLHKIIQKSADGIIVVDRDGVVCFVNPAAENLFARQKNGILGDPFGFPVVPGENAELDILRKDGKTATVEMRVVKIEWQEQPAYLASLRDITERKKSEQEIANLRQELSEENQRLMESNERLKELDNLKTDFLMTASHELRTPLTIIQQYIAIVRDGMAGPINKEQEECLESSLKNCNRLGNLLNDILDFERIQSGRQRLKRRSTDISALLKCCYHDFLPRCKGKHQQLELVVPEGLPNILSDEEKIQQILVNLLGNAQKFTQENGQIIIKAHHDNKKVIVSIQDNGPGIGNEDQKSIFDKFTQIERKAGPGAKGTGLGLAISKKIIEMHDGILTVDSTPGEGCTFSFALPIYDEKKELYSFISDRAKIAETIGMNLFLILLKIGRDGVSSQKSPGENEVGTLKGIEETTDRILRRNDDEILLVPSEGLLAIMMEADDNGARAFVNRLGSSLVDSLELDDPIFYSAVKVGTEIAAEELLDSAINKLKRMEGLAVRKRVLIVDDEEDILPVITGFLESTDLDLKIESTTSGYDACIKFGIFAPDLVILDIVMRGFDGIEVLKKIKENPHKNHAKILVMSGHSQFMDDAMHLGADDFLLKTQMANELARKAIYLLGEEKKGESRLAEKVNL